MESDKDLDFILGNSPGRYAFQFYNSSNLQKWSDPGLKQRTFTLISTKHLFNLKSLTGGGHENRKLFI